MEILKAIDTFMQFRESIPCIILALTIAPCGFLAGRWIAR